MDPSLRAVLGRVLRALMLVIGVLIGLGLVGLDLTALSVFGGALGVGLGLGFQRIASNYVSGFIVLLERMVRIGDMVKVDQFSGRVQTISTRYTVLRGLDGIDNIVPNELLTSLAVQNFSRAGALRLKVVVQIAYESDFDRAAQLAQEAALATPRVLVNPAPLVVIKQMAATGIELELGFSIADPENGQDVVRSAITQSMLSKFAASGISVPFAQREVSALDARQTDGDSAPPANPAKGVQSGA
jgi:small-conductance mechanosensitive channel